MLILIVFLYGLAACILIWMALFQSGKHAAARARRAVGRLRLPRMPRLPLHTRGLGRQWLARGAAIWARRRIVMLVALGLAAAPAIVVCLLASPRLSAETPPRLAVGDERIGALLAGEQLLPPAPLPPLAFTSAEVTLVRPMLAGASRNWQQMHPQMAQRLLTVFKIMREQYGYDMALLEGYRSPERQNVLASMGGSVTNARAFQSWHQYGLAADCAFLRNGRLLISEKDPWAMQAYQRYGAVAESLGLVWGGRWTMVDLGHTELRLQGVKRP